MIMMNSQRQQAQVSANPNQMSFNPMMGMMGGMMNGMDQNAMMGMNPMIHDAIETLNDLAKTSIRVLKISLMLLLKIKLIRRQNSICC